MGVLALAALLLALAVGVLPLGWLVQLIALLTLLLLALVLLRRRPRLLVVALVLLPLCWSWGLLGRPQPGAADPVHLLPAGAAAQPVQLTARLLEDPRPDSAGLRCRALARVPGGRTQLQFSDCPALQLGWRLAISGELRRLPQAPHPLLAGPAQRLIRQGAWSLLRVERWQVLERTATPVADLRRRVAAALRKAGGDQAGGLLSALVLGSAVSPVPAAVRDAFRSAGLSHALAARVNCHSDWGLGVTAFILVSLL